MIGSYGIIIIIIISLLLVSFWRQRWLVVFHRSLSDNKSPRISRTFLSIQTDFHLFRSPFQAFEDRPVPAVTLMFHKLFF